MRSCRKCGICAPRKAGIVNDRHLCLDCEQEFRHRKLTAKGWVNLTPIEQDELTDLTMQLSRNLAKRRAFSLYKSLC